MLQKKVPPLPAPLGGVHMADMTISPRQLTGRAILTVLVGWLCLAALFGGQRLGLVESGEARWRVIAEVIVYNALWALASLMLLWVIRSRHLNPEPAVRFYLLQVPLSLLTVLILLALHAFSISATGIAPATDFRALLATAGPSALVIYWMVLAAIMVSEYREAAHHRRLVQQQLERNLLDTRLAMLRAQLNPHFLFNTLNTISGLIDTEPGTARRLIVRLGELLRSSLAPREGAFITLADELQTLQAFLEIERIRFGPRLQIAMNIEPACLHARLPDFVLQPLVENALQHGLSGKSGPGRLELTAERRSDRLRLTVSDDGAGFRREGLIEGVGLRNTRERIAMLGDSAASMRIDAAVGQGCSVTIDFPWQ
ncbi:sensor histidine kinase [Qipengyuania qiaonensis]|uniref:Histidine kinase n=1 Tax=Qipengyuania qiaonensis TaxID=2867240 RepID=A0ABS7J9L5_9SPHN|nr:histidine kinase [Qipengyuania qiaonensis]MBX7484027.1 histidine kinase [Qipengyuania qiaonensis]